MGGDIHHSIIAMNYVLSAVRHSSTGKRHLPIRWDTGTNLSFLQLGILTTGPGIPRRPSGPGFPGAPWGPMGPVFPGGPSKPASPWVKRQGVELVLAHPRIIHAKQVKTFCSLIFLLLPAPQALSKLLRCPALPEFASTLWL